MAQTPVSRMEIADYAKGAFNPGGASRAEILEIANAAQARPQVIRALERLSNRTFPTMRDLWYELHDIPVEVKRSV